MVRDAAAADDEPPAAERDAAGAIEAFVSAFHRFEVEHDLFARCVDGEGFAWWDVVRYAVQMAIATERDLIGGRQAVAQPWGKRARSGTRQVAELAGDLARLGRMKHRRAGATLFVYGRPSGALREDAAALGERAMLVANAAGGDGRPLLLRKRSIDSYVRLTWRNRRVPSAVAAGATRLDGLLRARFDSHVDLHRVITAKYRRHRAAQAIWRRIFDCLGAIERVGYVNDDTLKTMVALAKARGIGTREYQHGYMGGAHFAFAYPPLSGELATLPDELVVDADWGDIGYPARTIVKRPRKAPPPVPTGARDIDVLIGGSPTRNAEAMAMIGALANRGFSVAIKLHPAQSEASTGLRSRFGAARVAAFAGDEDFRALARRARIYLPANAGSTTSFEAVEEGARLLVLDYGGVRLTSAIDGLVSARTDSFDRLPDLVAALLAAPDAQGAAS